MTQHVVISLEIYAFWCRLSFWPVVSGLLFVGGWNGGKRDGDPTHWRRPTQRHADCRQGQDPGADRSRGGCPEFGAGSGRIAKS